MPFDPSQTKRSPHARTNHERRHGGKLPRIQPTVLSGELRAEVVHRPTPLARPPHESGQPTGQHTATLDFALPPQHFNILNQAVGASETVISKDCCFQLT